MSLPPAQPAYILRGHSSQIHSTRFIRNNSRLVTGDAEGWIVLWSLASKRAVAVWRAHESTILGVEPWGDGRLITHGKDNKLVVWKLSEEDESGMSKTLPVDSVSEARKQPWLLYCLDVNTMNFCSFAACKLPAEMDAPDGRLLLAVPHTLSSETIDIFELPSSKRIHTLPKPPTTAIMTGMVMAISMVYHDTNMSVVAGYESGHTAVTELSPEGLWQVVYMSRPHSQPILSLEIHLSRQFYFTSSADAIIAKHPIPYLSVDPPTEGEISQSFFSRKAGNVSSDSSFKPEGSLLSQAIADMPSELGTPVLPQSLPRSRPKFETTPLKLSQTRHAGQQGLHIRDDGKIFATAGWDARARVYSVKTMKELAVLKWHKEGCFTVSFASVAEKKENVGKSGEDGNGGNKSLVPSLVAMTVQEQRLKKAEMTHWVAVGSKDGKVSLWDIY